MNESSSTCVTRFQGSFKRNNTNQESQCQSLIRWIHVLILDAPTHKGLRCTIARTWLVLDATPAHLSIAGEVRLSPCGGAAPSGRCCAPETMTDG